MTSACITGLHNTLLPPSPEAFDTLQRFCAIAPGTEVTAALNANFDYNDNTLRGWYCRLPPEAPAPLVPLQPNIFDGITVVEACVPEYRILELLRDKEDTLCRLSSAAQRRLACNVKQRVSWARCHPQREVPLQKTGTWHYVIRSDNLPRYTTIGANESVVTISPDAPLDLVPDDTTPNYVDSAEWTPELSVGGFIGLYHQWYPLVNGTRELKLFFVCQSHCQLAGMEVKQIVNDIPHDTGVYDLACSEEIWWLQNVNTRNRTRLIFDIASEMGIAVPAVEDAHSCSDRMMADSVAHTFTSGFYVYRDGHVGIASECVPTTFVSNGIVCKMSPWEGVGLFKGPHAHQGCRFGTSFGHEMDVFPTSTVKLAERDEPLARRQRLIVHHSSAQQHDFWNDSSVKRGVARGNRLAVDSLASDENSGTGDDDDTADVLAHGFTGTNDPEMFETALRAWRRAKRRGMSDTVRGAGVSDGSKQGVSYISFNDHVIFNKLEGVSWDQRYGMVPPLS
eukprot:1652420-Rhodomonas_salina.3